MLKLRWVTARGDEYLPSEMTIGHLNNTALMVWNNIAPFGLKITDKYTVIKDKTYTKRYLFAILESMLKEILSRKSFAVQGKQVPREIIRRYELLTGRKI